VASSLRGQGACWRNNEHAAAFTILLLQRLPGAFCGAHGCLNSCAHFLLTRDEKDERITKRTYTCWRILRASRACSRKTFCRTRRHLVVDAKTRSRAPSLSWHDMVHLRTRGSLVSCNGSPLLYLAHSVSERATGGGILLCLSLCAFKRQTRLAWTGGAPDWANGGPGRTVPPFFVSPDDLLPLVLR